MSTRAIHFLKKKKIPFEVVEYDHQQKGALFASEAIHFPLERTIKTLVADSGSKSFVLALLPGNRKLDLKLLARGLSVKKTAMAEPAMAERITGYLVGGISPFGTRQTCRAVIEEGLLFFDKVAINGGKRGTLLIMDPTDIRNAIDCTPMKLVSD